MAALDRLAVDRPFDIVELTDLFQRVPGDGKRCGWPVCS